MRVNSGSSPRVRGTAVRSWCPSVQSRFIPARAGNSHRTCRYIHKYTVHPRACGEQNPDVRHLNVSAGSSPRVRGTAAPRVKRCFGQRFIPARAGNRSTIGIDHRDRPVHPRACGEQRAKTTKWICDNGSSPRVRGTDLESAYLEGADRFIPARAGNRLMTWTCKLRRAVHPRACGEQIGL